MKRCVLLHAGGQTSDFLSELQRRTGHPQGLRRHAVRLHGGALHPGDRQRPQLVPIPAARERRLLRPPQVQRRAHPRKPVRDADRQTWSRSGASHCAGRRTSERHFRLAFISSLLCRSSQNFPFPAVFLLIRPASSRRICAVTRGFQTTTQDLSVFPFLPRHCHMTHVLLLPFITTVWTLVVLAIINII